MKKTLISASVVFAIGYTVAIAAQFAGFISFNLFGLPVLMGGALASGLVAFVFSDYSRRPSFRVRRPQDTKEERTVSARPAAEDPVTMWTYTTRQA